MEGHPTCNTNVFDLPCGPWKELGPNYYRPGAKFVQLTLQLHGGCGVFEDGIARCWGGGSNGASKLPRYFPDPRYYANTKLFLTNGTLIKDCAGSPDPAACQASTCVPPPFPPIPAQTLSVGDFNGCAVRAGGNVTCWGKWGKSDNGGLCVSAPITQPASGAPFSMVSNYGDSRCGMYACGVQESGQVECWGKQGYDQGWGMANGFNKTNGDVVPPWAGFDASLGHTKTLPFPDVRFSKVVTAGFAACGLRGKRVSMQGRVGWRGVG